MHPTDVTILVDRHISPARRLDAWVEAARREDLPAYLLAVPRDAIIVGAGLLCGLVAIEDDTFVIFMDILAEPGPDATYPVYARRALRTDWENYLPVASVVEIKLGINSRLTRDETDLIMESFCEWFKTLSDDYTDRPQVEIAHHGGTSATVIIRASERLLSAESLQTRALDLLNSVLRNHPRPFWGYVWFTAACALAWHKVPPRRPTVRIIARIYS